MRAWHAIACAAAIFATAAGTSAAQGMPASPAQATAQDGARTTATSTAQGTPQTRAQTDTASAGAITPAPAAPAAPATALDARLKRLELELRCLVCQNQTLADSDAPLAADLRREVRALAVAGKSDDAIRSFLTDRYGDFVLYNPPLQRNTWLLWFGPFALLSGGALMWWRVGRSSTARTDATGGAGHADATNRGRALLD